MKSASLADKGREEEIKRRRRRRRREKKKKKKREASRPHCNGGAGGAPAFWTFEFSIHNTNVALSLFTPFGHFDFDSTSLSFSF